MRKSFHIAFLRAAMALLALVAASMPQLANAHELDELLNEAAQHTPDLLAAKWRAEQMLLRHRKDTER